MHPGNTTEGTDRWLTPPEIVHALGTFDLDPCGAPGHDLATSTYLLENGQDGTTLPWFGRVWLNPPYGRAAEPFLRKLVKHAARNDGPYTGGTALIFARTETFIFHETVWEAATAVFFFKGRLTFLNANGEKPKANAGAPSCLVAYGNIDAAALKMAADAGKIRGHYRRLR